jgi:hypothetical protein
MRSVERCFNSIPIPCSATAMQGAKTWTARGNWTGSDRRSSSRAITTAVVDRSWLGVGWLFCRHLRIEAAPTRPHPLPVYCIVYIAKAKQAHMSVRARRRRAWSLACRLVPGGHKTGETLFVVSSWSSSSSSVQTASRCVVGEGDSTVVGVRRRGVWGVG